MRHKKDDERSKMFPFRVEVVFSYRVQGGMTRAEETEETRFEGPDLGVDGCEGIVRRGRRWEGGKYGMGGFSGGDPGGGTAREDGGAGS